MTTTASEFAEELNGLASEPENIGHDVLYRKLHQAASRLSQAELHDKRIADAAVNLIEAVCRDNRGSLCEDYTPSLAGIYSAAAEFPDLKLRLDQAASFNQTLHGVAAEYSRAFKVVESSQPRPLSSEQVFELVGAGIVEIGSR